ncbi:hypothetical protein TWF481_006243 [Arthrobotrys musiformis]|uniref:Uncharacterized protein n=1 Tax=Arthrobotrys musiformis TaxID=47236 RepID=A0AAV9WG69_9PEZI
MLQYVWKKFKLESREVGKQKNEKKDGRKRCQPYRSRLTGSTKAKKTVSVQNTSKSTIFLVPNILYHLRFELRSQSLMRKGAELSILTDSVVCILISVPEKPDKYRVFYSDAEVIDGQASSAFEFKLRGDQIDGSIQGPNNFFTAGQLDKLRGKRHGNRTGFLEASNLRVFLVTDSETLSQNRANDPNGEGDWSHQLVHSRSTNTGGAVFVTDSRGKQHLISHAPSQLGADDLVADGNTREIDTLRPASTPRLNLDLEVKSLLAGIIQALD